MTYQVTLSGHARRDRGRLPHDVRRRVDVALLALENNPRPPGCLKLTNSDEWRIRLGTYRIGSLIDDAAREVTVTRVGHRRDFYDR